MNPAAPTAPTPTTPAATVIPASWLVGQRAYRRRTPRGPITLRLDANEGEGPSPEMLESLRERFGAWCSTYPDASHLEATIAAREGIPPESVLVTAGADDALQRLCRVMLEPGRRALMTRPTFEMIPRMVRSVGAAVDEVPWMDGPFPARRMAERVSPETSIIFVVSPNNPTGQVATAADLAALSKAAPDALIVLDHAYVEFAEQDLSRTAMQLPNVAVTKTMSKAWGLAGLRVGFLLAPPQVVVWARAAGLPYAVSGLSLALAGRCLAEGERAMRSRAARTRAEVGELTRILSTLGARPLPSEANFVLARVKDAALLSDLLAGLGIAVRAFPDQDDLAGCVRIGCPGEEGLFRRLADALRASLRPEAILLDLDALTSTDVAKTLGPAEDVRRWAGRYSIGLVTATQQGPAERWAREHGLADVITVLRDGPDLVSSGANRFESALARLGVRSAWVITATPEGVGAARSASAAPLGITPAGDGSVNRTDELLSAGAARVLTSLSQFSEILP